MKENKSGISKLISIIGIVLCVVFGLMLLFNITIIVKGLINSSEPPSVFGVTPLVVKSGSMSSDVQHPVFVSELVDITPEQAKALKPGDTVYTMSGDYKVENKIMSISSPDAVDPLLLVERPAKDHIEVGDLIFSKKVDPAKLKVGDIISFLDNSSVVTHRIIRVNGSGDQLTFTTKGDANNSEDTGGAVPAEKVVGVYKARIPALGDFIYFLQKPLGMVIFIGVPMLTFIIYDIIRRSRSAGKKDSRTEELEAELARLRALAGEEKTQNGGDKE